MEASGLTNPLSVEHLLDVKSAYRSLRELSFINSLPATTNWVRWRYLDDHIQTKLASVQFSDPPTISIHKDAFTWADPLLLRGLIRHELLHLVLGASEGHGALFTSAEESWDLFHLYNRQKRHFFTAIHTSLDEHTYRCPNCEGVTHTKRRLRPNSACLECCKAFNAGKWCEPYVLIKVGNIP